MFRFEINPKQGLEVNTLKAFYEYCENDVHVKNCQTLPAAAMQLSMFMTQVLNLSPLLQYRCLVKFCR